MGADTFIMAIKDGLLPDTTFTKFTMQIGIGVFFITVIQAFVITDEEDAEGFFGKAVALTKGIIYKKTNYLHVIILAVYTAFLMMAYFGGDMKGSTSAIILVVLILLNLAVPFIILYLLSPDRIKSFVGEPSDIEKKLSNKGADKTIAETFIRLDFWYMAICTMIVTGTSRLFDENAESLAMHNDDMQDMISDTYGVFEVIGAVVMGSILTFFRSKIRPSLIVVFALIIGGVG